MKDTKGYKISKVLFCAAPVLLCVSAVTGLLPGLAFNIDKICMYLGLALLVFGFVFLKKAEKNK